MSDTDFGKDDRATLGSERRQEQKKKEKAGTRQADKREKIDDRNDHLRGLFILETSAMGMITNQDEFQF